MDTPQQDQGVWREPEEEERPRRPQERGSGSCCTPPWRPRGRGGGNTEMLKRTLGNRKPRVTHGHIRVGHALATGGERLLRTQEAPDEVKPQPRIWRPARP